jgi:hypothetical protein
MLGCGVTSAGGTVRWPTKRGVRQGAWRLAALGFTLEDFPILAYLVSAQNGDGCRYRNLYNEGP